MNTPFYNDQNIRNHFSHIIEIAENAIICVNKEGNIILFNKSAQKMFGYDVEEILSQNLSVLIPDEFKESHGVLFQNFPSEKKIYDMNNRSSVLARHKNSTEFLVKITISISQIENSEVYIAVVKNVTEEQELREELKKHKEHLDLVDKIFHANLLQLKQEKSFLKELLDSVPDLIYYKDDSLKYLGCNVSFAKHIGRDMDDIRYQKDKDIFEEETALLYRKEEEKVLKTKSSCKKEEWRTNIDGRKQLYETWRSVYHDVDGNLMGLIGISRDITERKSQQKDLEEAMQNAQKANITKSAFLANMSHEIRTPMNGIIGFLELLLRSKLNYEQYDYATKMKRVSNSLLGILNDILDFSKIEAGKMDIENIPFCLDDILEELADQFSKIAFDKNVEFIIDFKPDLPVNLIGDAMRIRQILVNLVSNALKFTEKGEVVIQVDYKNEPDSLTNLVFSVKDTGVGISQKQIEKLFMPFMQLDNSNTRKYGGTGLGLSICQKLTFLMGGHLSVGSEINKGTTFSFSISLKKQENSEVKSNRKNNMAGLKALIIDNQKNHRYVVNRMLLYFGFYTRCISKLEDLSFLENDKYDLIVCSWILEDIKGIEILEKLKSYDNLLNKPLIMLAHFIEETEIELGHQNGVNAFLSKPIKMSILFDVIIEVFEKTVGHRHITRRVWMGQSPKNLRNTQVLLVEDNEINQQIAKELLETADVKVSIANNGKEAVESVKQKKFDLVLMDVQMPEMDGYEATKYIRSELEYVNLPIIAMTAYAMSGDREKCLKAGMSDYITKPIEPDRLFATLIKWVEVKESVSEVIRYTKEKITPRKLASLQVLRINVDECISRLGHDQKFLNKILTKFVRDYDNIDKEILASLEKGDGDFALKTIHNLKGVAGNIAARELETSLKELESGIKNADRVEYVWNAFCTSLNLTMDSIKKYLEDNKEEESSNTNRLSISKLQQSLLPLFQELETNIKKFIPKKSCDIISELKSLLPPELENDLEQLERLVRKYSFKEARNVLAELQEKVKKI